MPLKGNMDDTGETILHSPGLPKINRMARPGPQRGGWEAARATRNQLPIAGSAPRIATDAAVKHWQRTRVSRPCPSRDDRRLFTKVAKEAVSRYGKDRAA